jgi:hypothetical protein
MYNKGDVLVCSCETPGHDLIIGDQYKVTECLNFEAAGRVQMSNGDKVALFVTHIKTGKEYSFLSDKSFIPLSVYREFKLRNVLD